MFEAQLVAQLKRIFDFDKVTLDLPGETQEQEAVFVAISAVRARIKDGRQSARVQGTLHVFANSHKLPFGYFAKAIDAATAEEKRGLFFFNFEENGRTVRNIVERSLSFLFLFDSQFDPAIGTLNQINLTVSET